MTITSEEMVEKLYSLDQAKEFLALTEPLGQHTLNLLGPTSPKFALEKGWNIGLKSLGGTALVDAWVTVGSSTYHMTKDAILQASSLIGLTKQYVEKTPANLIEPHLNYWFSSKDEELKLLTSPKNGNALAFTKGSIVPFSNLALLEGAVDEIAKTYDVDADDIKVDYKLQHDLRLTRLRLIVPGHVRSIRDTNWSTGIQFQNSIVGEKPTSLRGYLFTWACTNGQISTHAQSGNWNRRTGGQGEDVYDWARSAVDGILGGLEHELDAVEEIAEAALSTSLPDTIADVFQTYKVPMEVRDLIITKLVEAEPDPLTMYDIMYAITEVANNPDVSEAVRNTLMEIGGDLPRANAERCNSCHRLQI